MPVIDHQDLLSRFNRGDRIIKSRKMAIPNRSPYANKSATLIFQPTIERWIKTIQVFQKHVTISIQKFR